MLKIHIHKDFPSPRKGSGKLRPTGRCPISTRTEAPVDRQGWVQKARRRLEDEAQGPRLTGRAAARVALMKARREAQDGLDRHGP